MHVQKCLEMHMLFLTFLLQLFSIIITFLSEQTTSEQASSLKYAVGDVRNCAGMQQLDTNKPLLRMNVLPGLGFDNLRNLDMGQVLYYNYSMCQVSGDGLYLLPNDVYLIPIQESKVDIFSQVADSFQDHSSETASSINFQFRYSGLFSSISASFSTDYQHAKSTMVKRNSSFSRVSLRYKLFIAHMQPDAQLHPTFKSRLLDVAAQIQNNNTKLAHYLSELLVRDYGTHVITSVDAGAGLSQTTFISNSFFEGQENRSLIVSAAAGQGFGILFFKESSSLKTATSLVGNYTSEFSRHTTNSHISAYGGPMFRVGNFTLSDWEDGVLDHLVAIDRSGVPLYSVVNTNNLPELPDSTLLQLMGYVYNSVTKYYQVNTISGCMNPNSSNFNFHANVDDKSCEDPQLPYTFGGIYQTCYINQMGFEEDLCISSVQTNPLTQDYSCPTGYKAILLHRGVLSDHKVVTTCKKSCFFCHTSCWSDNRINSVTYSAYWCAHDPGQIPTSSGMMFGGVYTSKEFNLLTGARTCPPCFYPLHFGLDIWVCVSSDANRVPYSVPFGGFDSCINGNALAATRKQFSQGIFPHKCPKHYSQFLVTVDEGCLITFCADMRSIMQKVPHPPKLPPYHPLPHMSVNVTNTLVIKGAYGAVWIKNQADGTWQQYTSGQQTSEEYLREIAEEAAGPTDPPSGSPNAGGVTSGGMADGITSGGMPGLLAGVAIGSIVGTVMIGALVALVVFGIRKVRKKLHTRNDSEYLQINEGADTGSCNSTQDNTITINTNL